LPNAQTIAKVMDFESKRLIFKAFASELEFCFDETAFPLMQFQVGAFPRFTNMGFDSTAIEM